MDSLNSNYLAGCWWLLTMGPTLFFYCSTLSSTARKAGEKRSLLWLTALFGLVSIISTATTHRKCQFCDWIACFGYIYHNGNYRVRNKKFGGGKKPLGLLYTTDSTAVRKKDQISGGRSSKYLVPQSKRSSCSTGSIDTKNIVSLVAAELLYNSTWYTS